MNQSVNTASSETWPPRALVRSSRRRTSDGEIGCSRSALNFSRSHAQARQWSRSRLHRLKAPSRRAPDSRWNTGPATDRGRGRGWWCGSRRGGRVCPWSGLRPETGAPVVSRLVVRICTPRASAPARHQRCMISQNLFVGSSNPVQRATTLVVHGEHLDVEIGNPIETT